MSTAAATKSSEEVWVELKHEALGVSPEAKVAFTNGKLFRISASGSLLELGDCKTLAAAGKIVKHEQPAASRVAVPRAAFA
jgi:hypothetical protein